VVLPPSEIAARLRERSGWTLDGQALARALTFQSFPDAMTFAVRLAFAAEAADHHPDLQISYRRVTVRWSTHSEGGVTEKDFVGAQQSDDIAARLLS
jgi:4a-hydroxytetrahydrobiopterin dehydratase